MYLSLILLLFYTFASGSPIATQASPAVPISKQIASLSIEFCYIIDYLGDVEGSNKLSKRLLQNVQDISGLPPLIRIGGHTQDAAKYCSNCTDTLVNVFVAGNAEAVNVTYNKNLFSVLNNHVPSKQQFIFGLNLGQDEEIFPQEEVEAAEEYLRDSRIQSYELGNEPDFFSSSQRQPPWNVQTYTAQIISWIKQIQAKTKTKRGWQVGALAQLPQWQGNFSIPEFNVLGVPKQIQPLVAYSDHTYPYSICDSTRAALVSLPGLMNHTTTVNYFSQWTPSIQAAHSANTLFYMGETGSVSCHGKPGVSNTMGAALWELDYVLNGASIGMDGVFFHMGTPFFYSMWQPVAYNGTAATVYPTYNTLIIVATALSTLETPYISSIAPPADSPNLAVYALYPSAPASSSSAPSKLIVLNLDYYATNSTSARPTKSVNAGSILHSRSLRVSRFTAASAESTSGATFGGQNWENRGVVIGDKVYEKAAGGVVEVGDSEGVLIEVYSEEEG